jgi:hypothetical protein
MVLVVESRFFTPLRFVQNDELFKFALIGGTPAPPKVPRIDRERIDPAQKRTLS